MIALGIRYLTKYAAATDSSRQRPEWPPHPGRVFMAMAAAHFDTGADVEERAALEWLESAAAPALRASGADDRTTVRTYVPVNDDHGGIVRRSRQDRAFPRTRPWEDSVFLIWNADTPAEVRECLGRLCGKVTRIGHSSSAVQMWVVDSGGEPEPNWLPGEGANGTRLRVAGEGTLEELERAFNGRAIQRYDDLAQALGSAKGKEKARLKKAVEAEFPNGRPEWRRPQLVNWQAYSHAESEDEADRVVEGPFEESFLVLTKNEGAALGLETTLQLTGTLRIAAMKAAGEHPPEWLTGHTENGAPSLREHVAYFPLPYVGYEHSDGHVMGLGMAIPKDLGIPAAARNDELRRVLGPLLFDTETGEERDVRLWRGSRSGGREAVWDWTLVRETRERPPVNLRRSSWTKASHRWASVTPLVLHHHPKKREGDIERIVREAFVSALFPEPEAVRISSVSAVQGAGHALGVPPFSEGGENLCRYQTHVEVLFRQPVSGPMLVGRGRFRGYGLFRPLDEGAGD